MYTFFNHLMYADDLEVLSPCSVGLQPLLRICLSFTLNLILKEFGYDC